MGHTLKLQRTKTSLELEKKSHVDKHIREQQQLVDAHNSEMLRANEESAKEIRKYQDSYHAEKKSHANNMEKVRKDFIEVKAAYETALGEVDRLTSELEDAQAAKQEAELKVASSSVRNIAAKFGLGPRSSADIEFRAWRDVTVRKLVDEARLARRRPQEEPSTPPLNPLVPHYEYCPNCLKTRWVR